jgi:hypothetical protein
MFEYWIMKRYYDFMCPVCKFTGQIEYKECPCLRIENILEIYDEFIRRQNEK